MSEHVKCPLRGFEPCDPLCGFAVWSNPSNGTERISTCAVAVLGSRAIGIAGEARINCVPLPKEER